MCKQKAELSSVGNKLLLSTALCAATMLQPAQVFAADVALEEVIVTAQKRAQGINDVGITVNAFNAEMLENYGVHTADDLEAIVPGLTITSAFPSGVPIYTIRGVGFADSAPVASSTVGLYFDEVSMPYAVMTRGALFDMERVEVLKGPQGDLYGRNTTAGQINFVSRKPTDETEAGVKVDFSRFNVFSLEGYLSGAISDKVQGRLSTQITQSDSGWQQSITRPGDTLGKKNEIAVRGLLNIELSEVATLKLNLHWFRDKSDNIGVTAYDGTDIFGVSQPLPTGPAAEPFFKVGDNRAADWPENFRPKRDNTLKGASAKFEYAFDGIDLTTITAFDKFDRFESFETAGVDFADALITRDSEVEVFSQEIRLSSNNDDSDLYWIVGAYYSKDTVAEDYFFDMRDSFFGVFLGINEITTDSVQDTDSIAGFAHVEWQFDEQFKLTLGTRYTEEDREWTGCTFDTGEGSLAAFWNGAFGLTGAAALQPGDCAILDDIVAFPTSFEFPIFSDSIATNKWMWKATLDYSPNDDILLYGTVSTGFKSGGFNGAAANAHSQLLPYRPETLTSYELGLKSTLLEGRMQFNAAAFYYDYKDKQEPSTAVTPVGNIAGLTNVPKSRIFGAEAEVHWLVTEGLTIDAGLAYLDTEITEYQAVDANASAFPNVVTFDASGSELANAPKWQANATVTYEWAVTDDLNMLIAGDISHKTDSDNGIQDPVSDYTLVNARIGVYSAANGWRATIWGRNLFNEYYWSAAFAGNGTFARVNGMPVTYGITLSYDF